jgi:hypothetical protein
MNEVRLLVESFERLDSAHRNFTQGVISYERLAEYRDAALAQIDATEAALAARDAKVARLRLALLRLADVSRRFAYPDDGDGVTDEAFCAELDAAQKLASE